MTASNVPPEFTAPPTDPDFPGVDIVGPVTPIWEMNLPAELTCNFNRRATPLENKRWLQKAEENRADLVRLKMAFLVTAQRKALVDYLKFRKSLGYIEGVSVPEWLMSVKAFRGAPKIKGTVSSFRPLPISPKRW